MARPKTTEPVLSRISIKVKSELQELAINEKKSLSKLTKELIELGLQEKKKEKAAETKWQSRRTIHEHSNTKWLQCLRCKSKQQMIHYTEDGYDLWRCTGCKKLYTIMPDGRLHAWNYF